MLPKQNRLPLRQLREFFALAKRINTPHFVLYNLKREVGSLERDLKKNDSLGELPSEGSTRVAIIIAKQNLVKSTARNYLKRLLARFLSPLLSLSSTTDLVVYPKRNVAMLSQQELEKAVRCEVRI